MQAISRDRCGLYAQGASEGAPRAVQVADRFHLVLNLSGAIERVLEERSEQLLLPPILPAPPPSPTATVVPAPMPTAQHTAQQERRQRRLERYQQIVDLYAKGYSKKAISRELDVAYKTVGRWLRTAQFPERKPATGRRRQAAVFTEYLQKRWNEGCHNATQLYREIRIRGYKGYRSMVGPLVSGWRKAGRRSLKASVPTQKFA